MKGWIALNRRLRESEIWQDSEPFCPRSAWVDILFMANWKDKTWHDKTRAVSIPRGSFVTSVLALSERWKWSRGKISRFLARLVELEMISVTSNKNASAKWTMICVTNYDAYQRVIDSREVDADTERTLNEHRTDTEQTLNGHSTDITEQRNNITKRTKRERTPAPEVEIVKAGKYFAVSRPAYDKLMKDFGREKLTHYIKSFNGHIEAGAPEGTPPEKNPRLKEFKNHSATIRNWERRDFAEGKGFHKANGVHVPTEQSRPRPPLNPGASQVPPPNERVARLEQLPAEVQAKLKEFRS